MSQIQTKFIADSAVTTAKINNSAVDANKLATDAVTTAKIQNSAVDANKLATDSVTTAKIAADAVTGAKIRLDNDQALKARNAANSANIDLIKLDASDKVVVLDSAGAEAVNASDRLLRDSAAATSLDFSDTSDLVSSKHFKPSTDGSKDLGSTSLRWSNLHVNTVTNSSSLDLEALGGNITLRVDDAGEVRVQSQDGTAVIPVKFFDADNSNSVAIQAPSTLSADITFTLPDNDGASGQVLRTDGSGVLSWVNQSSGASANKETFTLSGTDITNQYIDLAQVATTNSIHFIVKGGAPTLEGASHDYSVNYTGGAGGKTRISFLNDLATGGAAALVATDVVQIVYTY